MEGDLIIEKKGWSNPKNVIIGVLCCLVALAIGNIIYQTHVSNIEQKNVILNDSAMQKEVKRMKDKHGRELVAYKLKEVNYQTLLTSKSKEIMQLRQDLSKVGGKIKNVVSSTTVYTTTTDSIIIPVHDTLFAFHTVADTNKKYIPFDWKDDWLSISGTAKFRPIDTVSFEFETIAFNYDLKNSMSQTHYWKGGFLKKKELHLLLTNDNPHTTVNKVQTYTIKYENKLYEKWWFQFGIGAAAGFFLHSRLK